MSIPPPELQVSSTPGPGEPFDGATDPTDLSRPLYGASFGQAVTRFFKQYAKFSGRASRSEYWWAFLFQALVFFIPLAILFIGAVMTGIDIGLAEEAGTTPTGSGIGVLVLGYVLLGVLGLALLVPELAVAWRRLHDGNFAGPFWFLNFIPSVGSIIIIVFLLLPSRAEGRRFISK